MLKGSIVALITPFTENNEVNYNKLHDLIEMHAYAGTDALLLLGTTSESSTLTEEECKNIIQFVINQNDKRMMIVVAVITNNTLLGIEKAKMYEKLGADYLLVTPPYYNKANKTGLIQHFKCIANSVNIPNIIYNIPSRIGFNIGVDDFLILKEIPNVVGVKESNKDINHIIELSKITDQNFNIYCGNDDLMYLFLSLGAKGLINVYGNLDPKCVKNLLYIFEENEFLARKYFLSYYNLFKSI